MHHRVTPRAVVSLCRHLALAGRAWPIGLCLCLAPACIELPHTAPPHAQDSGARATPQAGAEDTPPVRVGCWNVRKLGFEQGKDIAGIAAIIEQNFDLVGLLEIMWSKDDAAFVALLEQLGPAWQVQRTSTPRPNLSSPQSEYYAVAARSAVIAPCAEFPQLALVADGDGSDASEHRGVFLREPAFGCYRVRAQAADNDFLLAVYHAEWGEGQPDAIASEVVHIDSVFETMRVRFPLEKELFIVGDFNLLPEQLVPLTSASDRSDAQGSTLDAQGNISDRLYDHLLALGDASNQALLDDAKVLDVRSEAFDPKAFRSTVSDHLPLVAQLRAARDDD